MRSCYFIAIALAALAWPASAAQPVNAQYAACTKTVHSDPDGTYKRARAWYGQSKSLASQHCMALALYQLKDYKASAETIENILHGLTPSQGKLWFSMKEQAAKAHLAAGNNAAAIAHIDDAVMWAQDKQMDTELLPLLLQRAKAYENQKQYLNAVQDLDHAQSIAPSDAALLERARVFLKMGKKQPAREDIESVLKTDPKNKVALSLLALTGK